MGLLYAMGRRLIGLLVEHHLAGWHYSFLLVLQSDVAYRDSSTIRSCTIVSLSTR